MGALIPATLFGGLTIDALYCGGRSSGPGRVHPVPVPQAVVSARSAPDHAAAQALGAEDDQILFGDLHVHTTYSGDAFLRSLPLLQGEGAHPPADACDFARFCSGLDFFALTDHAETITPKRWAEERETIRQCNAVAGDAKSPDLVAFSGWEWTQVGLTPETHYGHKNVIFRDTDDAHLPTRVISATGPLGPAMRKRAPGVWKVPLLDWSNRHAYFDFLRFTQETGALQPCPVGVPERNMPLECREEVATPRELFDRLADWGFESMVIPHGTTWGFYTPPGSDWKKQLTLAQHDPARQQLFEVYSGHGNSEEYRSWKAIDHDPNGALVCPAPSDSYEPCCHRAGEIIRGRCGDLPKEECDKRVAEARVRYLAGGTAGHLAVPGAKPEEWGDCGQCRDCFDPAFNYRPGGAAQFVLATTDFGDPAHPKNHPFGFIASSDNHSARPGTGFKEFSRRLMTEATGARDEALHEFMMPPTAPTPEAQTVDPANPNIIPWMALEFERQASFFMTGGLVAVHARGRSRDAVWGALQSRNVYGTSGDRILLWFELTNGGISRPMGSEVTLGEAPKFVVRAAGAFEQLPGCDAIPGGPPAARLESLCRGECYRPGAKRKRITRIEVIRIRPQTAPGEPIASLISDPWRTFPCPETDAGCKVEFEDPDFASGARDVTYYVRAIEAPSPAINASGLRCERDAKGVCVKVHPCWGDYRTDFKDDCLAPNEERAWSSPIFVRRVKA
ncbi:MAG: DUF3604 domain-containing protein [Deltaproteobacteria bacterium]|nr:DUF3604 domain-containing protein [Deltaproteobacteria bacterium]